MLAALLITSPPDLRLVMFWSPMLIGPPVMLMELGPNSIFGPFVVLEMEWMSTKSLFTSYLTTPSASTEAVVFLPFVKFKPLSNVTFCSFVPFAL